MRESKSYPMKTFVAGLILVIGAVCILSFKGNVTPKHLVSEKAHKLTNSSSSNKGYEVSLRKKLNRTGLSENILTLALAGFNKLNAQDKLSQDSILTIIDYTKSSKEKRLYVIDLKSQKLVYKSLVAHGKNSGGEYARSFSNKMNSLQSSIGFYITEKTYDGNNGYSLRLRGVEKGFNNHAKDRAIVIHGAAYASEEMIRSKGYLGRSFGCPSLPPAMSKKIIETIKDGNCVFAYYPDKKYLNVSQLLNG